MAFIHDHNYILSLPLYILKGKKIFSLKYELNPVDESKISQCWSPLTDKIKALGIFIHASKDLLRFSRVVCN